MKAFIIDAAKCNGCFGCQLACKDEHVDNEWLPFAKPQPDMGHFWMKVSETVHGQVPKVKMEYRPMPCMHCESPACMITDAVYKREDGLVIIDPVKAAGQKELIDACPYGAIYWNEKLQIPQKCTGCAHLVDAGEIPHCVDLCATGALRFGEAEDFAEEIAQAETFGDPANGPRVYYLNLPHLFIAGDVWDPDSNEIIEGARVTLTSADGKEVTVATDDFGDFWFNRLSAGVYDLKIEANGFKTFKRQGIALKESLNIGDFPMEKDANI